MKMKTVCTNSDYVAFIGYCREYVSKLRLGNWEIDYKFKKCKESPVYADCQITCNCLRATITLFSDWTPDPVNTLTLKEIAYHEVCHLLFAPLIQSAFNKEEEVILREHEHNLIRNLCLFLFRQRRYK